MARRIELQNSLLSEHLEALEQGGRYSVTTISLTSTWLLKFEAFLGSKSPTELKVKDLEDWNRLLAWTPGPTGKLYSENTINQAVGSIRRFYRWLLAEGRIKTNPAQTLQTKKAKIVKPKREYLASEIRELLGSPDLGTASGIRSRALLGVLLETKASHRACSGLDLGHLCFDTETLLTKGRQQKIHALSFGLLADLKRYLQESRPLLIQAPTQALFLNKKGERLSKESVNQVLLIHRRHCGL